MNKTNDAPNLEYYKAKQDAGQLPGEKPGRKKPITKNLANKPKTDGYVAMNEVPGKAREFERYKEITFAQKASERAKQNPMIP